MIVFKEVEKVFYAENVTSGFFCVNLTMRPMKSGACAVEVSSGAFEEVYVTICESLEDARKLVAQWEHMGEVKQYGCK